MIEGELGALLEELGREFSIANLAPDEHGTCLIRLKNGIKLQLEMLKASDYLLIATDLGEIPPGRYRIDLFESALQFNVSDEGGIGTLGFSRRTNHMLLFETAPIKQLKGLKVAEMMLSLSEKAKVWKEAIQRGDIPRIDAVNPSSAPRGIFGLR